MSADLNIHVVGHEASVRKSRGGSPDSRYRKIGGGPGEMVEQSGFSLYEGFRLRIRGELQDGFVAVLGLHQEAGVFVTVKSYDRSRVQPEVRCRPCDRLEVKIFS